MPFRDRHAATPEDRAHKVQMQIRHQSYGLSSIEAFILKVRPWQLNVFT
jgi:hypothetical protein